MNENEFTYKGKTYMAVPVRQEDECRGCHLFYDPSIDCIELIKKDICPSCCPNKRQDGKDVIFIPAV